MADINWSLAIKQPSRFTLRLRSPSLVYASPLVGAVQTVGMPGARWGATLEWPAMRAGTDSAALEVLLAQLRGRANRLVLWHLARPAFRGVGGGSPTVNGGGQTGTSLQLSNLPISTTGWALPGDMIGVNGELKMVTAPLNSNSGGQGIVEFEPALRASPGNGVAITLVQPTAKFIAADDAVEWTYEPGRIANGFKLELVEAF